MKAIVEAINSADLEDLEQLEQLTFALSVEFPGIEMRDLGVVDAEGCKCLLSFYLKARDRMSDVVRVFVAR